MSARHLLSVCALLLVTAASATAEGVRLLRVWPAAHEAEEFTRIAEYLGGATSQAGVHRTQPGDRGGFYFTVRYEAATAAGAVAEIAVLLPGNPEAQVHRMPVSLDAGRHTILLGLTGRDWPLAPDAHPVAWRVTLRDSAGTPLASQASFLWSDADLSPPAAPQPAAGTPSRPAADR